ncbi:hypothetical protein Tco_0569498 [Tanacetum coccineum]
MVLCRSRRSPPYGRPPTNLSKLLMILLWCLLSYLSKSLDLSASLCVVYLVDVGSKKSVASTTILIPFERSFRAVRNDSSRVPSLNLCSSSMRTQSVLLSLFSVDESSSLGSEYGSKASCLLRLDLYVSLCE